MVMKFKGKESPVSMLKLILHDSQFEKMKYIAQATGMKNNAEVINHMIDETFKYVRSEIERIMREQEALKHAREKSEEQPSRQEGSERQVPKE